MACYVINDKIILSLIKHSLGYTEGFQQFLKKVAKVYDVWSNVSKYIKAYIYYIYIFIYIYIYISNIIYIYIYISESSYSVHYTLR